MLLDNGALRHRLRTQSNPQTFELTKRGAKITRDQTPELLPQNIDLVVRTAAVKDNNPQFQEASPAKSRPSNTPRMLGMIMGERFGIAVAGTHGNPPSPP